MLASESGKNLVSQTLKMLITLARRSSRPIVSGESKHNRHRLAHMVRILSQHAGTHVISDIRLKGATANYGTRVGERFHQERRMLTQLATTGIMTFRKLFYDANQEAIALIRMSIDDSDKAVAAAIASQLEGDTDNEPQASPDNEPPLYADPRWKLGSPMRWTTSITFEDSMRGDTFYSGFNNKLCAELAAVAQNVSNPVKLHYQSLEDWTDCRNILRCHPRYFGHPRYDCVLINTDSSDMVCACLRGLVACEVSGQWRHAPRAKWECRVYEESQSTCFVMCTWFRRSKGKHTHIIWWTQ
ncbi:hypothetical protein C8J57DRAFT_1245399 [Mycena rebaudengoi]|nr:hypothetical protein C8J57DRAFT_1245399 [Mycena rebaudengoi]